LEGEYQLRLLFEQSVEVKAGESKIIGITFESRKDIRQPEEITYEIQRVTTEYPETLLSLPEGLKVSIEPSKFTACPNTDFRSSLRLETSASMVPSLYWFLFQQHVGIGSSGTCG
jgi:hypothetical protein